MLFSFKGNAPVFLTFSLGTISGNSEGSKLNVDLGYVADCGASLAKSVGLLNREYESLLLVGVKSAKGICSGF